MSNDLSWAQFFQFLYLLVVVVCMYFVLDARGPGITCRNEVPANWFRQHTHQVWMAVLYTVFLVLTMGLCYFLHRDVPLYQHTNETIASKKVMFLACLSLGCMLGQMFLDYREGDLLAAVVVGAHHLLLLLAAVGYSRSTAPNDCLPVPWITLSLLCSAAAAGATYWGLCLAYAEICCE